jgi:hypothetical protein
VTNISIRPMIKSYQPITTDNPDAAEQKVRSLRVDTAPLSEDATHERI